MTVNYSKIASDLLKGLSERTADIVQRRFGLKTGEGETLEAIGQSYDITRERVRQIEEEGLSKCRKKLEKYNDVLDYFFSALKTFGDVKKEDALFLSLGGEKYKNHAYFLMVLSGDFKKIQDDEALHTFWTKDKNSAVFAKKAVNFIIGKFKEEKLLVNADRLFSAYKSSLEKFLGKTVTKEAFASYLELSKDVQKNHEGKLGLRSWLEVNPRGIKDKAYLVFKKENKPLHFSDVASYIDGTFASLMKKKAHVATVHNELIKDGRFVLIGRGMYALKEWGYEPGIVKEIVALVMKKENCPMTREEIAEKVLKQRLVKANTVFLNLLDKNLFLKDEQGKYIIKEA